MAKRIETISETIRRAIIDSGEPHLAIEKATGVKRQSIAKFIRGDQSLRLDMADRLAEYLRIECRQLATKGR